MAITAVVPRRKAPWRNRRKVADPKNRSVTLRYTAADYELLAESAGKAGLAVGPFLRAVSLGSPGPRAVPCAPVDRVLLAKALAELGKLGSNVNQIARIANTARQPPRGDELARMKEDVAAMRAALMEALGRGD